MYVCMCMRHTAYVYTQPTNTHPFPPFLSLTNDSLFKPILHIVLLIWKNSAHYNTPAR